MAIRTLWAPKCLLPICNTKVDYRDKKKNQNGSWSFTWNAFCRPHREKRKFEVDNWKLSQGCANAGVGLGENYGPPCTCSITKACQLDVHHKDGDHRNTDPSNVEVLCANCHRHLTQENGDHLNNTPLNETPLPGHLFDVSL